MIKKELKKCIIGIIVGRSINVTPWVGGDLISFPSTAGSHWAPENETIHIFPHFVFLPPFTRDRDVSQHPTAVPINIISCYSIIPKTTLLSGFLSVYGFYCRAEMPGICWDLYDVWHCEEEMETGWKFNNHTYKTMHIAFYYPFCQWK